MKKETVPAGVLPVLFEMAQNACLLIFVGCHCCHMCAHEQQDLVWPCALMYCIVALLYCDLQPYSQAWGRSRESPETFRAGNTILEFYKSSNLNVQNKSAIPSLQILHFVLLRDSFCHVVKLIIIIIIKRKNKSKSLIDNKAN